jgi:hypothetical protein
MVLSSSTVSVEARIDQFEADHPAVEDPGDLAVCPQRGSKTVSGQDDVTDGQQIALPFVDVLRVHRAQSPGLQPRAVGG